MLWGVGVVGLWFGGTFRRLEYGDWLGLGLGWRRYWGGLVLGFGTGELFCVHPPVCSAYSPGDSLAAVSGCVAVGGCYRLFLARP